MMLDKKMYPLPLIRLESWNDALKAMIKTNLQKISIPRKINCLVWLVKNGKTLLTHT